MNSNKIVEVKHLKKTFDVSKTASGSFAKFKQFICPRYESLNAVDDISFAIERGEKVAFIGPNGAGKSTTIKLLTGIFQPSHGSVKVFNLNPFIDRKQTSYKIGTVFGQRSQLWYHLPAFHSFRLLATIYDIDRKKFEERLEYLTEIFQLSRFLLRPIKELSLGERMRCELVGSLLHNPEILFLDEPTIGLDIISKEAIRQLINERAKLESTTIFLTSHDIADIEKVCDRIILINNGKIVIDDSVKLIKNRYIKNKIITMKFPEKNQWTPCDSIRLIDKRDCYYKFEIDLSLITIQDSLQYFSKHYLFTDITIEDPPLEEIIKGIYKS